jgi:uncharacterized membrane protein YbhN (UPF0104 family)
MVLPGGGGGVEVATSLVLRHFVRGPLVGVVLLLWRFFTYHLYLFTGGAVFFLICARLSDLGKGRAARKELLSQALE